MNNTINKKKNIIHNAIKETPYPNHIIEKMLPYELKNRKKGFGICRYCCNEIKYLKNQLHLRTHYLGKNRHSHKVMIAAGINFLDDTYLKFRCFGSRRLDYYNQDIIKISENFEKV